MSEMDIDAEMPHNQPLPSEPETPQGADFDEPGPGPRRRRAHDDQVEKVTDETGEMVRGAFLLFLETYSPLFFSMLLTWVVGLTMTLMARMCRVRLRVARVWITFTLRSWRRLSALG